MSFETSGFDGLDYDLERMVEGISPEAISRVLEAGSNPVIERIIANAPIGPTGRLKDAIEAGKVQQKDGRYTIKLGVINGKSAPHAHLVEHGHGGPHPAPPHPFMRPAFDAEKEAAYAEIRDTLRNEMTKG